MIRLRILICGRDNLVLKAIAQTLSEEGVKVQTTTSVIDCLYRSSLEWDFLLVDVDRLSENLCGLLPAVHRQFPGLQIVGISTQPSTDIDFLAGRLELDDYLFKFPRPEDLIACFPGVAANYLYQADPL